MRSDAAYLADMVQAARDAMEFTAGLTLPELTQSRLHQHAILKALEIVGEAASQVSVGAKDQFPMIPWHELIGMRNRVVHAYFGVDFSVVWRTVHEDLPALISHLEPHVPPEETV